MPSCVLRYCSNHTRKSNKTQGVTFHKFPRPDDENRESWIKFVQKNRSEETWLPSDHARICSVHFKTEDKYTTKNGRLFLKKNAMPYDQSDNVTTSVGPDESDPLSEPESDSSILDTPRIIVLKKQLRKECAAKRKLVDKIRKVQRQNNYLKRKCAYYKTMVKNLKEKFILNVEAENE